MNSVNNKWQDFEIQLKINGFISLNDKKINKKLLTKGNSFVIISNVDTLVWLNGRAADL